MQKRIHRRLLLILATLLLISTVASAQCKLPQCSYARYRSLGMAIDGYLEGGVSCLRQVRDVFESGGCDAGKTQYFKVDGSLAHDTDSSWNKPPMSWVVNALDDGDSTSITRLQRYALDQQDPAFGYWGKEITSWMYWGTLPALATAYHGVQPVRQRLRSLLQGHVGLLTLFSAGDRIFTPSIRTKSWNGIADGVDYFVKQALGLNPPDPPGSSTNDGEWDFRISKAVSHNYMAETVRQRYLESFLDGSNVDWVVAKLNAVGVTFRAKVHIWRYQNGDFATLIEKNINGNDPPVYAVTRVNGVVRKLGPAVSTLSPIECVRNGNKIETSFGEIPAPSPFAPLVYHVTIGPSGVTRVQ
ncbi:MAG: hypothetical protein MI919_26230 [Holophagales bacterium]|nr:hypothetical protein [Holophagales bacterium]